MGGHSETTDYGTGGTRHLVVVELVLITALCFSVLGYVLAWTATESLARLGFSLAIISPSVTMTLGWLVFLVVIPVYVVYRFCVDWSFTGTQVPDRRGLTAFAASSLIWLGTEILGVHSYEVTIVVLAMFIVGLYKMTATLWAVYGGMIHDATSPLFDQ